MTCLILPLFAYHCGILAERSTTRLLASRKWPVLNSGSRFSNPSPLRRDSAGLAYPVCQMPKRRMASCTASSARQPGFDIPNCRRSRRRIWRVALQTRPRSADWTRSPAAISQKREFFNCPPETIGYFAPKMPKIAARRPVANSQKPAIGRPFCWYQGHFLQAPDCLAGDAVVIAPVSKQIPC